MNRIVSGEPRIGNVVTVERNGEMIEREVTHIIGSMVYVKDCGWIMI